MKILSSKLSRKLTSSAFVAVAGIVTPAIADPWACQENCQSKAQIDAMNASNAAAMRVYYSCGPSTPQSTELCMMQAQAIISQAANDAFSRSMNACVSQCWASV